MVKLSKPYTGASDPPLDPDPFPPAVAAAERELEEVGRDMMRRAGSTEADRAVNFDIIGVLEAVENWIRAKDGRETKMCISCSKTSVPAYGLRWNRDVTYTCSACNQPELSMGETPEHPIGSKKKKRRGRRRS